MGGGLLHKLASLEDLKEIVALNLDNDAHLECLLERVKASKLGPFVVNLGHKCRWLHRGTYALPSGVHIPLSGAWLLTFNSGFRANPTEAVVPIGRLSICMFEDVFTEAETEICVSSFAFKDPKNELMIAERLKHLVPSWSTFKWSCLHILDSNRTKTCTLPSCAIHFVAAGFGPDCYMVPSGIMQTRRNTLEFEDPHDFENSHEMKKSHAIKKGPPLIEKTWYWRMCVGEREVDSYQAYGAVNILRPPDVIDFSGAGESRFFIAYIYACALPEHEKILREDVFEGDGEPVKLIGPEKAALEDANSKWDAPL